MSRNHCWVDYCRAALLAAMALEGACAHAPPPYSGRGREPHASISVTGNEGRSAWSISLTLFPNGGSPRVSVTGAFTAHSPLARRTVVARRGRYFLTAPRAPHVAFVKRGSVPLYDGVDWLSRPGIGYYHVICPFVVWKAGKNGVVAEAPGGAGRGMGRAELRGERSLEATGTLELIYVPGERSSYAHATFGVSSSGGEAGDGVCFGNWHAPKPGRRTVTIPWESMRRAPYSARWRFAWAGR